MTTKKVSRSKSQGKRAAKAPAEVLREQKAKIEEIHANSPPPPRMPTERHPASDAAEAVGKARKEIADLVVPMTFSEVCSAIGHDVNPEKFAATALMDLAGQIEVISELAERTEFSGYEAWAFTQNVAARMRLASRVAAWFDDGGESDSLPEVAP